MTHALEPQRRSESDLTAAERDRLTSVHQELSEAVADYDRRFVDGSLQPGLPVPVRSAPDMARAQARIDAAEENLWRTREDLLGWQRPAWAPRAATVADWFSDEDAAYDSVDEPQSGDQPD